MIHIRTSDTSEVKWWLLPLWPDYVPHLSIQPKRCSIRLVLLPTTLKTGTGGNLLTRSRCSLSSHQSIPPVYSKATNRWNASLYWNFWSMKSSTPSKIIRGSDAWNRSSTISHFLSRRNIAPTTNVKGTKLFIVGPSENTWKSSSNIASSKSTSTISRQFPDNRTRNLRSRT